MKRCGTCWSGKKKLKAILQIENRMRPQKNTFWAPDRTRKNVCMAVQVWVCQDLLYSLKYPKKKVVCRTKTGFFYNLISCDQFY